MPPRTRQDTKPADAAQVADAPEPPADDVDALKARIAELEAAAAKPQASAEDASSEAAADDSPADMCEEHFPQGFASDIVKWIEERTGRQYEVSCEHGTYRRTRA